MNARHARAQDLLAALAPPKRFELVALLARGRDLSVSGLALEVGLSQSCTTRHLQALERAGLVRGVRDGKRVVFHLRPSDPTATRVLVALLPTGRSSCPRKVRGRRAAWPPHDPRRARARRAPPARWRCPQASRRSVAAPRTWRARRPGRAVPCGSRPPHPRTSPFPRRPTHSLPRARWRSHRPMRGNLVMNHVSRLRAPRPGTRSRTSCCECRSDISQLVVRQVECPR